ncbi:uncharacterized protein METZ01_LOCUS270301 [marine metagenome]|uniref:Uncharacterized protein n=1 Tax=marine metagenome TaxID=408172 RepID=A0A382K302_9ZZZZ|tara:strand:- start:1069 stop:1218 length:150 start_codon:yes stop_codon:yes gene_type:complete
MIASGNNVALGDIINGILPGMRIGKKYRKTSKSERNAEIKGCPKEKIEA